MEIVGLQSQHMFLYVLSLLEDNILQFIFLSTQIRTKECSDCTHEKGVNVNSPKDEALFPTV